MKILTCFCCGAEITCPQFFNGKAYGYTCILKVNPNAKRTKKGPLYVECEIDQENIELLKKQHYKISVSFLGSRFLVPFYSLRETNNGYCFPIAKHQTGADNYYPKALTIKSVFNSKNKKVIESITNVKTGQTL